MATMYDIVPLGTDACRFDPSAPCAYWHTKVRALALADLGPRELDFVGLYEPRPPSQEGWHEIGDLSTYELDRQELSAEVSALLGALMGIENVTQGMAGFLG